MICWAIKGPKGFVRTYDDISAGFIVRTFKTRTAANAWLSANPWWKKQANAIKVRISITTLGF